MLARLALSRVALAVAVSLAAALPGPAPAQDDHQRKLRAALEVLRGDAPLEEEQKALRLLACAADEVMVGAVTVALIRDPS